MPKASRGTASEVITMEGLQVHVEHLDGGYTVCLESHRAEADLGPLLRGLPDDRCVFPRWAYVVEGGGDRCRADEPARGIRRLRRPASTAMSTAP